MNKYICLIVILIIIICSLIKSDGLYISKSTIDGLGLFAGKDYKTGNIIIPNIFHNKPNDKIINNIRISKSKFDEYIIEEGKYINHCSVQYNSDVITKDKKIYKLIAIKDIKEGEEITANYDRVHFSYPFIAKSSETFNNC